MATVTRAQHASGVLFRKASSFAFPTLSAADLARFLDQGRTGDDTAWVRSFRALVREVLIRHPERRPEE